MTSRRLATGMAAIAVALGGGTIAGCSLGGDDDGQGALLASGDTKTETTRVEVVEGQGDGQGFDSQSIFKNEGQGVVTVISLFGSGSLDSITGGGGGGVGSGFVLNGEGEIATNAHVVTQGDGEDAQKAREVYVEFADGNRVEADIVGQDPNADVALLKIDPKGLTLRPLPLGTSASVAVGEPVAAIGLAVRRAPVAVGGRHLGDRPRHPVAQRRLRDPRRLPDRRRDQPRQLRRPARRRRRQGDRDQPADQDELGRRRGRRLRGPRRRHQALARRAARDRQRRLRVPRRLLRAAVPAARRALRPAVDKGAWVQEVQPGTPADKAGIRGGRGDTRFQIQTYAQGGDIITKVEGKVIEDANDLSAVVAQFQPGQDVTVEVHRGGETKEIEVKLGERPLSAPSGGG